jgi:hypothetical protein
MPATHTPASAPARRLLPTMLVGALAIAFVPAVPLTSARANHEPQDSGAPFAVISELYGDAGAVARQRMADDLATGFDFHAGLSRSERLFLRNAKPPFVYFSIPRAAHVARCYPSSTDSKTGPLLRTFTQVLGPRVWRLGMPEFDQGGGCWARGRPRFKGLTDLQAHTAWRNFYLDTKGLGRFLGQTSEQRGYRWMSMCVFAFCPQYAYDMGSDAVLLERNNDELSGITPGIAMIRGAATQHGGRTWGIDFSTWRFWNRGPTVYARGRLVTGWSASTFKRSMYIAYMAGAHLIHNEAAVYSVGRQGRRLNPLGRTVQQFTRFATVRHPDRGAPFVPMALMQDHYSGFEPRFGVWMQRAYKWYWAKPYSAGDAMFSNLLGLAFPNHGSWGSIVRGAPWKVLDPNHRLDVSASQAAYRKRLANGADPRPWEPMASSRWGETFDVITDRSSLTTMQHYRAIVLSTDTIGPDLLANLSRYVQGGGILIVNARQLRADADALTGVHFTGGRAQASSAIWLPDGSRIDEDTYRYSVATPTSASVLAQTISGDPIVTSNSYGSGTVYVTTPDFLEDARAKHILRVGRRLIDTVQRTLAVVRVSGPPIEYLVNTDGGRTIVTLVNTNRQGATWTGTLSFPIPSGAYSASEWTRDVPVGTSASGDRVVIDASVPRYGVRVYALTGDGPPSAQG